MLEDAAEMVEKKIEQVPLIFALQLESTSTSNVQTSNEGGTRGDLQIQGRHALTKGPDVLQALHEKTKVRLNNGNIA